MAASDAVLGYMAKIRSVGGIVVEAQPKLDLDLYTQNYVGRTRLDRLVLIGKSSVPLCVDALKAAINESKNGTDVDRYLEVWECIKTAAPEAPEAVRDEAWVKQTKATNKEETTRLEDQLKGYKNNLIKESIRMGNEDLGKHFESIGKLNEAAEAYSRMRQDASTTKHVIDCGIRLANIYLYRRDFTMVLSHIGKSISAQNEDADKSLLVYTSIVSGIALLGLGRFEEAAKSLLRASFEVPPSEYSHVASPNDVAVYGGLLALATMDRKALQRHVLDNHNFRTFLEHEPHIRKAISLFVNGRYSNCLSMLEGSKPDYLLDIYLQKHVRAIYSRIRSKCIVQYFVPFSCVTLDSLDAAFAPSKGATIVPELVRMIQEGSLKARIDAKDKLLVAEQNDARGTMQTAALKVAQDYEREAKERLRRISLVAAGLDTIGGKRSMLNLPSVAGVDESWYEEGANGELQGEVGSTLT